MSWRKEKGLLGVVEEVSEIRWDGPRRVSFPLDEVHDELGDFGTGDEDEAMGIKDSFFSDCEGDLDDKLGHSFEENSHQGKLSEDGGSFEASDSWFTEDIQVLFGGAVGSF